MTKTTRRPSESDAKGQFAKRQHGDDNDGVSSAIPASYPAKPAGVLSRNRPLLGYFVTSIYCTYFQLLPTSAGVGLTVGRQVLNIQPVVPIELNENWNLICRTILPVAGTGRLVSACKFPGIQVGKVRDQPVSFTGGARYWASAPEGGPEGWGFRLAVTLLFSK